MTQTIIGEATTFRKDYYLGFSDGTKKLVQTLEHTAPIPNSIEFYKPIDSYDKGREPHKASSSFRSLRKSGAIVMNPYSIWDKSETHLIGGVNLKSFAPYYVARATPDNSGNLLDYIHEAGVVTSHYKEQGDLSYWRKKLSHVAFARVDTDIEDKIEHAKTKVLANLNTSYDLLTELAEAPQTVALLASLLKALSHPLRTFKNERDALYKAFRRGELKTYSHLTKRVADAWLMARYGILPIVGSVNDVISTLKLDKAIFHTERSYEHIQLEDAIPTLSPILEKYFYEKASGSITIRATAKDRYDVGSTLQMSDLIGANFATTAWNLIPYSFVVDWGLNISDFLTGYLGEQTRLSNARNACISVKKDYRVDTFLKYSVDEKRVFEVPEWTVYGTTLPSIRKEYGNKVDADILLKSLKVKTYDRELFDYNNLSVRLDVSMNWKRWADSAALLFSNSRKRFAALR